VLFSEPKIPQSNMRAVSVLPTPEFQCSSASRKFLNYSVRFHASIHAQFQCSSASRKFLNRTRFRTILQIFSVSVLFSEPKIPQFIIIFFILVFLLPFQCSSASRKFLNHPVISALGALTSVSVLFSEPKIPQLHENVWQKSSQMKFQCSSASRKFLNSA